MAAAMASAILDRLDSDTKVCHFVNLSYFLRHEQDAVDPSCPFFIITIPVLSDESSRSLAAGYLNPHAHMIQVSVNGEHAGGPMRHVPLAQRPKEPSVEDRMKK